MKFSSKVNTNLKSDFLSKSSSYKRLIQFKLYVVNLFPINIRLMCLKTLNLSCIIRILSNPHIFHLNWVPSCRLFSQKYLGKILTKNIVLITTKFLMMNQKTGPCDPSNAYVSHTTPASCRLPFTAHFRYFH